MTTRSSSAPAPGSLVGRRSELQAFRHKLMLVSENQPAVIVLTGELGTGRTRLIREFSTLADRENASLLVTRQTGENEAPLGVFRNAYAAGPLQSLQRTLASVGRDDDHFGRIIDAMARATRPEPLWVMIDDLDAADEATRTLVDRMLAAIQHGTLRNRPIGLILSVLAGRMPRALAGSSDERGGDGTIFMELQPFDAEEITAWLAMSFDAQPDAELVQLLARASSGNPLLLTELAGHLQRAGLLRDAGGTLTGNVDLNAIALPCDLMSMLQSKADAVSGECRRAMTLAAFLGNEFPPQTLADLLGRSVDLESAVAEAERASLIERRGDRLLAFKHSCARDFFYASPDLRRRQEAHLEIGERLIEEFGEAADLHCLTISHHLVHAGASADPAKVIRFAALAAGMAFQHHSYFLAGRYYEAAAEAAARAGAAEAAAGAGAAEAAAGAGAALLPPQDGARARAELHCRAGEAFQRWSDGGSSVPCFDRALRLYEQCSDSIGCVRALQGLLRNHVKFGDRRSDAVAVADRLETLLPDLPDRNHDVRVRVHDTLASHYYALGQFNVAEAYAQTAMDIAKSAPDDPALRCIPVTSLALAQMDQLRLTDAKTTWLEGLSYDRAVGATRYEGLHLQRLPVPLYCMGELQEATRYNEASYKHNRAIGNTAELLINDTVHVLIANLRGDFEEAADTGYQSIKLLISTRYLWIAPALIAALSYALTMRERYEDARRVIDHLVTPGLLFDDPTPYHSMAARLMALLVTQGAGEVHTQTSLPAPKDHRSNLRGVQIGNVGMLCCEVELALFERSTERLNGIHDALDVTHRKGVAFTVDWCFSVPRSLGVSAALRGDHGRSRVYFTEAERLAERCGAPLEHARVQLYRALATLARDQPDIAQARADLDSALVTFEQFQAPVLVRLGEDARAALGGAARSTRENKDA